VQKLLGVLILGLAFVVGMSTVGCSKKTSSSATVPTAPMAKPSEPMAAPPSTPAAAVPKAPSTPAKDKGSK
jgi:hypothetical protein